MEAEQKIKMIEDIRQELAKGCYQMDLGELPYSGKARLMTEKLWEKGYRPLETDSTVYHNLFYQEMKVELHLLRVLRDINDAERKVIDGGKGSDASKQFASGLRAARNIVDARLNVVASRKKHWQEMTDVAIGKEWADE